MKIELIYFDGCPNIQAAKDNIHTACEAMGIKPEWKEWNQNDPKAPDYVKEYGSPTILLNGKDVLETSNDGCSDNNCRLYPDMTGVPGVELIQKAMEAGK